VSLYETLGFFGLIDFHLDVAPTLNRYLYAPGLLGSEHLEGDRTLENTISLGFTSSVKEVRESLIERAKQSYREFFWAFGIDLDDATAASHFLSYKI
jgi:hypothetical protein